VQIPVLIEPVAKNGYRASCRAVDDLSAEGATRDEALAKLRKKLVARMKGGAAIVSLEVEAEAHPLARFVGMFRDDPHLDDWKRSMADYRRKIDRDPEAL